MVRRPEKVGCTGPSAPSAVFIQPGSHLDWVPLCHHRAYRRSSCCRARAAAGGRYRNKPSAARRRLAEVYTYTVTRTESSEIGRPAVKGEGEQEAKGRVNFLMLIDSNKSGQEIPAQPYTWIRCWVWSRCRQPDDYPPTPTTSACWATVASVPVAFSSPSAGQQNCRNEAMTDMAPGKRGTGRYSSRPSV